jgi:hypothetical protein
MNKIKVSCKTIKNLNLTKKNSWTHNHQMIFLIKKITKFTVCGNFMGKPVTTIMSVSVMTLRIKFWALDGRGTLL